MSIASEITRIQGAKNSLKTKLNARNNNQNQINNETIDEYGDFVDSICVPLQYIESTGTQRIDTGIVRDKANKYRFIGRFYYSDVQFRQVTGGAQGLCYLGVIDGYYQICQGGVDRTNIQAIPNKDIDFDLTMDGPNYRCSFTIDGTSDSYEAGFNNNPADAHFCLFTLNGQNYPSACRIAFWQIYVNDVLTRSFIPVKDSNNVACMYDLVTKTFYYNEGTGNFIAGSVL